MQHLLIQEHSFEFQANKNTDLHLQYDFVQHRLALGTSLRSIFELESVKPYMY